MSDTTITFQPDPYAGEIWHQTQYHRWAVLDHTTTHPPVLQVAWQSSYGRIEWRRLETAVVSKAEYER